MYKRQEYVHQAACRGADAYLTGEMKHHEELEAAQSQMCIRDRRWEPSHAVFQAARKEDCRQSLELPWDAPELLAFLRGEEIPCEGKGYTAVCAGGVPTGFGKASGGRLKNHYPKGLRNL